MFHPVFKHLTTLHLQLFGLNQENRPQKEANLFNKRTIACILKKGTKKGPFI